ELKGLGFHRGKADQGGAILNRGELSVQSAVFEGNLADEGGAIFTEGGRLEGHEVRFRGNEATDGGAVLVSGGLFLGSASTFDVNLALGDGGGLCVRSGDSGAHVVNSTFTRNTSMGMGGAIHSEGAKEFRLVQSTVSRNSAELTGGGIHNAGRMTTARSIVAENDAGPDGGDVFGTDLSTTLSTGHNLFGRLAGSAISAPTDIEAEEAG